MYHVIEVIGFFMRIASGHETEGGVVRRVSIALPITSNIWVYFFRILTSPPMGGANPTPQKRAPRVPPLPVALAAGSFFEKAQIQGSRKFNFDRKGFGVRFASWGVRSA